MDTRERTEDNGGATPPRAFNSSFMMLTMSLLVCPVYLIVEQRGLEKKKERERGEVR